MSQQAIPAQPSPASRARSAQQRLGQRLRHTWEEPHGRLLFTGVGIAVFAVIVAGLVAGNYVLGGESDAAVHGPITAPTLVATNGGTLFAIDQSSSTVSFSIHEVLFGSPKTVIGKTQQVAGQILIDAQQPRRSELSTIRIDMATLTTDDDRRTHTLHSRILDTYTSANQYATFVPTAYSGLPTSFAVGQPVTFQLHGNLTVHQVTQPETFAVTVTQTSATQLIGTATTTVNYSDFKLAIPNIPFVTDVGKSVALTLDFTATKTK